jgi:cytoskeleton protein RodZ
MQNRSDGRLWGPDQDVQGATIDTMSGFGELLRQARDAKGASLREAERATRISRNYLSALENEEFSNLPAATYARGIVRNYAQYLGLDPANVVERFELAAGTTSDTYELVPAAGPMDSASHWAPNFAMIAFMVVMSAVIFAWMYSAYFQETGGTATMTVGVATMTPVSGSILGLVTPNPTVQVQGGGVVTTTPTPEPQATPNPETAAPATTAQERSSPAEEPTPTPEPVETAAAPADDEDVADDSPTSSDEVGPVGTGAHTFVIWTAADVWVQVVLDGEVVLDSVLAADTERIFFGDSATITSGNAASVQLWVDGVDQGAWGDTWNASFNYP